METLLLAKEQLNKAGIYLPDACLEKLIDDQLLLYDEPRASQIFGKGMVSCLGIFGHFSELDQMENSVSQKIVANVIEDARRRIAEDCFLPMD